MKFLHSIRIGIGVVCGSFLAIACKYSTPDPEVAPTSSEAPAANSSPESKESSDPGPPSEASGNTISKSKGTPEEAKRAPVEASGSCDDRSCTASQDCCSGYQCGFDPERSKVQRYCLPQ
jgi:hypothetical protein